MGIDYLTLSAAKGYTDESLLGGGSLVGKNVTISSITPIDGGNKVTFSYTLDNGTVKTSTMDVMDGKDGIDGLPGKNGKDGQPGTDGYTPVKGTDYWTETDVSNIINECKAYIDSELLGGAS